MHSNKSEGPRVTPSSTYSCDDLSARAMRRRLLLRKDEIRSNPRKDHKVRKTSVCQGNQHAKPCRKS